MRVVKTGMCFVCLLFFLSGCSRKIDSAHDSIKETENIQLVVQKKISDDLSVDINRQFDSQILKKYWIKAEPYPVNEKWAQSIADKYFQSETQQKVEEIEGYEKEYGTRAFSITDDKSNFSAVGNSVFISIDRDFYDNCEPYYHEGGTYPFFNGEMDTYYNQADLPFMTYKEAEVLSKSLLDSVGYSYNEKSSKGYSLSEDALMKYQVDHQERFTNLEDTLRQLKMDGEHTNTGNYIKSWLGTGGFYVFYYPIKIEGLELDEETFNTVMYAHIVINAEGIARAQIPCSYKVEKSESVTIVKPEIVLNKLIEMYENTILTSEVNINDVEFVFGQTGTENMNQTEFDIQYVISPGWKFNVQLKEAGNGIDGSVLYDAVSGERVG